VTSTTNSGEVQYVVATVLNSW